MKITNLRQQRRRAPLTLTFFFNDTATTEIYTLSLHDALPIWDYFGVLGSRGDGPVLDGGPMPAVSWFSGSTLNYARNALRAASADRDRTAISYRSEAGHHGKLTYGELDEQVAIVLAALAALGVRRGDR